MTRRRALFVGCALPILGACASSGPDAPPRAVPANAVAIVGDDFIDAEAVEQVARAQSIDPARALERLVSDAVIAGSATEKLGRDRVRQARRGALARRLLESLTEETRQRGSPTDGEIKEVTEKRWWELDRPPLLRTTHAVVLVKKPADDARARAVAGRIAERVAGISDPVAFRAAARAVTSDGLEVRVEDLPPIRRDGASFEVNTPQAGPGQPMVKEYADAAYAISAVGRTSPVIRTEFGYHVILSVALTPEHRVPLEELRKQLADEIFDARALAASNAVLAHGRSLEPVTVERSASDSMMLVRLSP